MKYDDLFSRSIVVHRFPDFLDRGDQQAEIECEKSILKKLRNGEFLNPREEELFKKIPKYAYTGLYNGEDISLLEQEILEEAIDFPEYGDDVLDAEALEECYGKFFLMSDIDELRMTLLSPNLIDEDFLETYAYSIDDFDNHFVYLSDFFDKKKAKKIYKLYRRKDIDFLPIEQLNMSKDLVVLYKYDDMYLCFAIPEKTENMDREYTNAEEEWFGEYIIIPEYILKSRMYYYVDDVIDSKNKTSGQIYVEIVRQINKVIREKLNNDYHKGM